MGLQQFERRLERLVEGAFAKAFRSGLQPVEIGRRLTREMDLRRTVAPRGTLAPNEFSVVLSPEDHDRFAPIEDELIAELVSVARDHGRAERYLLLGPISVRIEPDERMSPGVVRVYAELTKSKGPTASLLLGDGRRIDLRDRTVRLGRLPDCDLVLDDSNVSRRHAEIRPNADGTYSIMDTNSTNGTRVNGLAISGVRPLRDGDQITVGATTLRFESS